MKNKKQKQKIIICLLLLLFFFVLTSFLLQKEPVFAQKELETEYPEIREIKPETVVFPLTEYVKYIFNFSIAFAGIIALGVLIYSGQQIHTSFGKPATLQSAKDRIKSALLGLLLLFFSYAILVTINPQLVIFQLPGLEPPSGELPTIPISPLRTSDLLARVKILAENTKQISEDIKTRTEEIKNLTNECNCENARSLCICTGGGPDDICRPRRCYVGPDSHPCPDFETIKNNQEEILVRKQEILYYKNRVIAEGEDLEDNLEIILADRRIWYNKKIEAEEEFFEKLKTEAEKALQQRLIDYLDEERQFLLEEIEYKEELKQKLDELAEKIANLKEPTIELSQLPNECSVNVETICKANCQGGCYDIEEGCQPDKCSGGNPCPNNEIQEQAGKINSLTGDINSICQRIISIIDNIEETKERIF